MKPTDSLPQSHPSRVKGAHSVGWPWPAERITALAIPVVALSVGAMLRRLHARVRGD